MNEHIKYPGILAQKSVEVYTLPVPNEAIKTVVVNSEARQFLPKEYHFLLNPDTLISFGVMSVHPLSPSQNKRRVSTTYEEGRVVPVAEFQNPIPYADNILASFVTAKGTHVSGFHYANSVDNGFVERGISPLGFFGDKDSSYDTSTSNMLLSKGARASLSLGYLILDTRKVYDFLVKNWPSSNFEFDNIANNLRYFSIENKAQRVGHKIKDNLAIEFRLTGSRHRLGSYTSLFSTNDDRFKKTLKQKKILCILRGFCLKNHT